MASATPSGAGPDRLRPLQQRIRLLETENRQLRQSVDQQRRLFRNNPQPMFIYDSATLAFLDVNQAAVRLYGYSPEEFLRLTIKDIRPAEDVPTLLATLAQTGEAQRSSGDIRHRKKDGTVFCAETTSCSVRFNGRKARLAVVGDVTARTMSREALHRSETRFRTLSNSTFEGIVFSEQGVIQDTNEQFARMLGYEREELIGKGIGELLPAERRNEVMTNIDQGREAVVDHEMIRKDGSRCIVEAHGRTILERGRRLRITSVRDITRRKQAEEALRASEDRLLQCVQVARLGLFEHNHHTDALFISATMRQIHGWREAEAVNLQRIIETVHPEDRPAFVATLQRAHDPAGHGSFSAELRIFRPDGGLRWINVRSQTTFEGEKEARRPLRTIGAILDITARKQAENALRLAHDQLEQRVVERTAELAQANERLKTKMIEHVLLHGEIEAAGERERERLGRELHDGLGQLLFGARLKADALAQRLAEYSKTEARRAKAITDILSQANEETRALARGLEPLVQEPEGLMSALQQLAETTRKLFSVACRCEFQDRVLVPDHTVSSELLRIAQEAVNNAIKHGKARRITIELARDETAVVLTVTNNGKAFPKRPRSTGMGLRTMRYRAERIGGLLSIQSHPPGGTVVRCSLPHLRAELQPADLVGSAVLPDVWVAPSTEPAAIPPPSS